VENSTPLPPKPQNRSSPKFVWLITSWTITLCKIPSRNEYLPFAPPPNMRNCASSDSACFYRATLNAGPSSQEKAVCLSVRLSNAMDCDKTEESSVQIFILYKRSISLVLFVKRRMLGGEASIPEILGQADPVRAKTPIFSRYSLVAPQQ